MKKHILLIILLAITAHTSGQIKESTAIDSIFAEWNTNDSPGAALGIIKEGELIYAKGYGMANLEYTIPNSANSVFRIASTSKQFTAACIVLLAEKGKLSLDDNLKKYFPKFPAYAEKITIKQLLNHTSGVRDYLQLAYLKGIGNDDHYVDDDIMNWLVRQEDLNFEPGEEFLYSNSGYWLLGQIVQQVSGESMAAFAKKVLFDPLEMGDTHFHNDHTQIVKKRASGYMPSANNGYRISMTTLDMIGDGGIFTTINDIKKWDDAFYSSSILSKSFWKMMTQQGSLNNGESIDYAAGLFIDTYKGLKTIRHGGAFVGFRAELLRFPDQKLTVALFANRGDANASGLANRVADILLKDQFIETIEEANTKPKVEVPKEEFTFDQIIGTYEIEAGVSLSLSIKNDSLNVLQNWNKSSYAIAKTTGNTYEIPGTKDLDFTFSNLEESQTQTLKVVQGGRETIAKRKKEVDTSGIDLNDYVGRYYSKELNVTYIFALKDEVLSAKIEDGEAEACTISDIDKFSLPFGLARFQRTNDLVAGFELDSGRVKNLKFQKQ